MTYDTIVRGGLVALAELPAPRRLDVAIRDGAVVALLDPADGAGDAAADTIDASGLLVTPGAIDPHVHVSWPYLDARTLDDYESATRAAAAGGTTTIIDFAIEGREDPVRAIAARRAQADGAAVVDFAFHLVVSDDAEDVLDRLAAAADAGVISFKCYMTYRRRGIHASDAVLAGVAERVARLGGALGVHAENADLDDAGTAACRRRGQGAARFLPDAKPPLVEAEAVARAARLAAAHSARLWILHLSSAAGLEAALQAKRQLGQPQALETCPQYLLLDRSRLAAPGGHRFLCSPPLREPADAEALWRAVRDGSVDWVGSDHCLFTTAQKDEHADAFWDCPHGLPGVETRARLLLASCLERDIALPRAVDALAAAPARFFGLHPVKGTLLPGADADLALWDPRALESLSAKRLATPCDWTPYEAMAALAPPRLVLSRGVPVAGVGVTAPDGHGRFLHRPLTAVKRPGTVAA